jgi:DNA-binding beta-propeller fold protein YncE/mono/diheme cytochrome c family protein
MLAINEGVAQITTRFATGGGPTQVLYAPDGRAFVSERRAGTVSVFDPRSGRKLCTAHVAADPVGLALAPDGQTLYVTSGMSAKLTALNTQSMESRWAVDVAREPRSIVLNHDGSRAVLAHIAGKPVSAVELGSTPRVLVAPDPPIPAEQQTFGFESVIRRDHFARRFSGLSEIGLRRPSVQRAAMNGPLGLRESMGGSEPSTASDGLGLVGNGLQPNNPPASTTAQVIPIASQAYVLAKMQDSDDVVVPFMVNRTGREVPAIHREDRYGGGSVSVARQNEKVTFSLGVFDPNTMQWRSFQMPEGVSPLRRGGLSMIGRGGFGAVAVPMSVRIPSAIAINPVTHAITVASMGTSEIATITQTNGALPSSGARESRPVSQVAINRARLAQALEQHSPTVAQPNGLAITDDGTTLVFSSFDHTVEVRKGTSSTRVVVGTENLAPDLARGRHLFFTANNSALSTGGLSCGGCHPDGRDDGLVWFLANGPRQTPTLAGRLVAPFNWTGTHRTIEGNVAQTITRLGGTGLPISDVDAIAAFVSRVIEAPGTEPPVTAPRPELVAHGRDVFQTAGNCASCHDPNRNFTDGQPHEMGGLRADERERMFDTPSLRYVRATAPYFHDGRYASLHDVLVDGTAHMGNIGTLASADVEALEAYLLTL